MALLNVCDSKKRKEKVRALQKDRKKEKKNSSSLVSNSEKSEEKLVKRKFFTPGDLIPHVCLSTVALKNVVLFWFELGVRKKISPL